MVEGMGSSNAYLVRSGTEGSKIIGGGVGGVSRRVRWEGHRRGGGVDLDVQLCTIDEK